MEKRKLNISGRRYLHLSLVCASLLYLAMLLFLPVQRSALVDLLIPSTSESYAQTHLLYRMEPSSSVYLQCIMDTLFVLCFYPSMALLTRSRLRCVMFTAAGVGDMVENLAAVSGYLTADPVRSAPLWTNLKWLSLFLLLLLYLRGGAAALLNLSKAGE